MTTPGPSTSIPLAGGALAYDVGIETRGGRLTSVIPAGTRVPVARAETFATADNFQPSIIVRVGYGQDERVAESAFVGRYEVQLLVPFLAGESLVEVTFHVDAAGAFSLTARDATGDLPVVLT